MHRQVFKKPSIPNTKTSNFQPRSWDEYFDSCKDIQIPNTQDTFRVYFCENNNHPEDQAMLVLLHGGGHSSLSWACCAKILKQHYNLCAIDFRAHGSTITSDESDLSTEILVNDVLNVLSEISKTKKRDFVIIGHSMGGAIAVRTALAAQQSGVVRVTGLVVVDVVEGSALEALPSMHSVIQKKPKQFKSIQQAIKWTVETGSVKNVESACVSVPPQLKNMKDYYIWRTDLAATEKFWTEWFTGLSNAFLEFKGPKLLLLAGTDRLDKTLMIAQMQGKFVFKLLNKVGHTIQEDDPKGTACTILDFVKKFGL